MKRLFWIGVLVCFAVSPALAQDPVKVDPKHYKVVFENDQVRVLRIHYGPHEKSVMHEHPDGVATFLADQRAKFTMPDGKSVERAGKSGDALWLAGEKHLPENLSDKPLDAILVELKGKAAAAAPAKAAPKKK